MGKVTETSENGEQNSYEGKRVVSNDPIVQYAGGVMINHNEEQTAPILAEQDLPRLPSFVTVPGTTNFFLGDKMSLQVETSDADEVQWQSAEEEDGEYIDVDGKTDATYTNGVVGAGDARFYRVVATNENGSVTSSPIQVTVSEKPSDEAQKNENVESITPAPEQTTEKTEDVKSDDGEQLVEEKK